MRGTPRSLYSFVIFRQESHVTQTSHAEKAFDLTPEAASASPLLSKSMVPQHFVCVNQDKLIIVLHIPGEYFGATAPTFG